MNANTTKSSPAAQALIIVNLTNAGQFDGYTAIKIADDRGQAEVTAEIVDEFAQPGQRQALQDELDAAWDDAISSIVNQYKPFRRRGFGLPAGLYY